MNIASQAGKYGFPGGATYCASKAAVINLSRAVRKEVRGTGVEISVISPVAVNTELGLGLSEPRQRQFRKIEPQQVAEAIVETLRVPRFDVHVPKQLSVSERVSALLPIALQDGLSRVTKADAVLSQVDTAARAGYELRAARSEPGLPPAPSSPRSPRPPGGLIEPPRARAALSPREPIGDQLSDQRPLVLLEEVAGVLDGRGGGAADRLGEALAHRQRQDRVGVGPQHQRRPAILAQRLEHALPAAAPGASGALGINSGKARAPALEAGSGNGAS